MTKILVQPQQLRQTAEQLRSHAQKIDQALHAIDNDIHSLKGHHFLGQRADAVQAHYAPKRESLLQAKQLVIHFAEELVVAASTFEKADNSMGREGSGESLENATVSTVNSSGKFSIGNPKRPDITHDQGFLGYCSENPSDSVCSSIATFDDYKSRAKYEGLLRGAKAVGHLDNGTKAYEHFLYGNGEDFHYSYSEFVNEDAKGRIAYNNILLDVQKNIEVLGQGRDSFSITSEAYAIGAGDPRYPYPSTENWAKAIGAHQVWTSADVTVTLNDAGEQVYTMEITYHAEDRYNFNPGMKDIASGLKDKENGRFAVLGWGESYMSYGETTSTVTWTEGDFANSDVTQSLGSRVSERSDDARPLVEDR